MNKAKKGKGKGMNKESKPYCEKDDRQKEENTKTGRKNVNKQKAKT
jgi:hypothetical protein